MTSKTEGRGKSLRVVHRLFLTALAVAITGTACSTAMDVPAETKATPASVSAEVKPAENEAKQVDTKPVGREVKPADGPKLKSVTPAEGTILVGVMNDIAIDVPEPEHTAAAKAANASGTVTVEVMVNEKGDVVASSVVSGPQPLWAAAGAAARKARFDPPLLDGKPVKIAGVLTFDFGK